MNLASPLIFTISTLYIFMKIKKVSKNEYLLCLERGEEIVKTIEDFLKREKIKSGVLWGLGAVDYAKLAHYRVDKKEYSECEFNEPLEIASLFATITREGLHSHIVLSDSEMKTYAGHLKAARVAATGEIVICKWDKPLAREYSEEIGLKLLHI